MTIYNILQSRGLSADVAESFAVKMVDKPAPTREHIAENAAKSRMLVTALNPRIGYDKGVKIGKTALAEHITLKEAAARLGYVSREDADHSIDPADITGPGATLEGGGG